ncbi:hypothetical protein RSAG8_08126, partial [Rhizoctonia solani AG-8 WAC10335]
METAAILRTLGALGKAAPYITSLRLDAYGDLVGQENLQNMFSPALSNFPNLKTTMFTSQSLTRCRGIPNSTWTQAQTSLETLIPSPPNIDPFISPTSRAWSDASQPNPALDAL